MGPQYPELHVSKPIRVVCYYYFPPDSSLCSLQLEISARRKVEFCLFGASLVRHFWLLRPYAHQYLFTSYITNSGMLKMQEKPLTFKRSYLTVIKSLRRVSIRCCHALVLLSFSTPVSGKLTSKQERWLISKVELNPCNRPHTPVWDDIEEVYKYLSLR